MRTYEGRVFEVFYKTSPRAVSKKLDRASESCLCQKKKLDEKI